MRFFLLLALLLVASGCTLFDGPTARAEQSLKTTVWAFHDERQRFPHGLDELQAFADGRMSLDTDALSQLHFEHPAPEVLRVEFHTDSASDAIEAITFKTIY